MKCVTSLFTPHVASQYQQLRIQWKDGRITHSPGPAVLYFSRFKHENSIQKSDRYFGVPRRDLGPYRVTDTAVREGLAKRLQTEEG